MFFFFHFHGLHTDFNVSWEVECGALTLLKRAKRRKTKKQQKFVTCPALTMPSLHAYVHMGVCVKLYTYVCVVIDDYVFGSYGHMRCRRQQQEQKQQKKESEHFKQSFATCNLCFLLFALSLHPLSQLASWLHHNIKADKTQVQQQSASSQKDEWEREWERGRARVQERKTLETSFCGCAKAFNSRFTIHSNFSSNRICRILM